MVMGREGSEIQYSTDAPGENPDEVPAYLAQPASGRGRGILVIHENWGLTDATRDVCDRLARAGFVALAPDLFRGRSAEDRGAAQQLAKELDAQRMIIVTDIDAVYRDFGKPTAERIERMTADEAAAMVASLPAGSMGAKLDAAAQFVHEGGEGAEAIITRPDEVTGAVEGRSGTRVTFS